MLNVVYKQTINMDKIYRNDDFRFDDKERAYTFRNYIPYLSLGRSLEFQQRDDLRYIGSWSEIERILEVPKNSIYDLFSELANAALPLNIKHLKPISLVFDVDIEVVYKSLDDYM